MSKFEAEVWYNGYIMEDFDYLSKKEVYLDAACQSLRPRPVLNALNKYYENFNSCGERVKYKWGRVTDEKVEETRGLLLKYLKVSPRRYFTSFTLNTTYGINLILDQLNPKLFKQIVTSDIEHNSPFLATMAFARRNKIPRKIITRERDGSVDLAQCDFCRAIVVLNAASNIDGRELLNIKALVKKVHAEKGIVIIDAAQAMAHHPDILFKTEADAVCGSAHKMYAPSLGFIVARRDLLPKLNYNFVGGGMVDDVTKNDAKYSAENADHIYTRFESGLQAWGEIVAFGEALRWLMKLNKKTRNNLTACTEKLFDYLKNNPKIHLVNDKANPTMSFYIDGIDSHLVAEALSSKGIMCRSGYFCVHYYLDHVMQYPPLVRFSLGYYIRESDIEQTINVLARITK